MAVIKAFECIRPDEKVADRVAALPYDVYNREEALNEVEREPLSFLAIDRAETQFDSSVDTYADCVYDKARELLDSRIADGTFITDTDKAYYVYELTMNGRTQTGIAACASIDDYNNNIIKKHENTRADKEQDRINHVDRCSAQTGPIFLAYRADEVIRNEVAKAKETKPLVDKGCRYAMYFHYMPVGNDASVELLPTPEQRIYMKDRIRQIRSLTTGQGLFTFDFQNDGEFVGGCIAGGRNYFHINANGDAEPCVFIHYSGANIRTNTLLEILNQPLFMAYRKNQPFNKNHLRPCPMLENPEILQKMVKETGAKSTDLQSPETAEHLCSKCVPYANAWKPYADKIWSETPVKKSSYENYGHC